MLYIICAMESEARNIKCKDSIVIITGVGLVNVISSKPIILKPTDRIINIGYAGSNVYKPGTVKSVNISKRYNTSNIIEEPVYKLNTLNIDSAECYTSDNFEGKTTQRIELIDMELYYLRSIYPTISSIKIVSDNLNYSEYKEANFTESWETVNEVING